MFGFPGEHGLLPPTDLAEEWRYLHPEQYELEEQDYLKRRRTLFERYKDTDQLPTLEEMAALGKTTYQRFKDEQQRILNSPMCTGGLPYESLEEAWDD